MNWQRSAVLIVSLNVLIGNTQLAMGVELARGQGVLTRAKRDYFPIGMRLGTFKFLPTLSSNNEWRDNIYSSQATATQDLIFHIQPGALLSSDWNRHSLSFAALGDFQSYASNSSEDKDNYSFDLNGKFDVLKTSFAHANLAYANQYENRGQATSVFGDPSAGFIALKPTNYQSLTAALGYEHKINRFRFNLDHSLNKLIYQDGVAPVSFAVIENDKNRSRTSNGSSFRLGYELSSSYEAFFRANYNFIDYDSQFGADGLQRSSTGYSGATGVSIDITKLLVGDVYVGYQVQDYVDPVLKTVSGLSGGLSLKWNPTGLTTVTSTGSRTIGETIQSTSSGMLNTAMSLAVDHELLRNILLNATIGYSINEYQGGNNRVDTGYSFGFGAKYLLNRHFYLASGYALSTRSSDIANAGFTTNSFSLTLGSQL
ncbi:MAG: outer membrane beta-barrel protein [Methylovulum sp.]|nr:outer membrane beta-barrel protein [Methylovulum sp.]